MELPEHFCKNILKYISTGDSILIALSGGPDSVALLCLLDSLKVKYKLKLYAAHFNHMLRGRDSFTDAAFAEKICRTKSIPFYSAKKDIKKLSLLRKGGLEKTARVERYKFLIKCAAKVKAYKIAVGHNLDDNAETVLMRLMSGAGSEGLSGIADKRIIYPEEFGVKSEKSKKIFFTVIRPLSKMHKTAILEFLKQNKIIYRIDKTNMEDAYTRNKVRNRLLPAISRDFNPRIKDALASTGIILSAENDYMEKEAKIIFGKSVIPGKSMARINLKKFLGYHEALQRRVIRAALKGVFISPRKVNFETVESVLECAKNHGIVQLPERYFCFVKNNMLTISHKAGIATVAPVFITPHDGAEIIFNGFKFVFRLTDNNPGLDFRGRDSAYMDAERVKFPLQIRLKRTGDKFIPYGMSEEVRLKKFYNTCGLDPHALIIADAVRIIWVSGGRIDNRAKVTNATKRVLIIEKKQIMTSGQ